MNSRYAFSTSSPCSTAQKVGPPTNRETSFSLKVNEVTTPKFPPPPRRAQNRSGSSVALARTCRPSASTTSAAEQVVDGQSVRPGQVAESTAEGQAADAGRGDDAARGGEPVRAGRRVHLAPGAAAADRDRPGVRVHLDRVEAGEVDDQSVVAGPESAAVVPAAAHGQEQTVLARDVDARTTSSSVRTWAIRAGDLSIMAL